MLQYEGASHNIDSPPSHLLFELCDRCNTIVAYMFFLGGDLVALGIASAFSCASTAFALCSTLKPQISSVCEEPPLHLYSYAMTRTCSIIRTSRTTSIGVVAVTSCTDDFETPVLRLSPCAPHTHRVTSFLLELAFSTRFADVIGLVDLLRELHRSLHRLLSNVALTVMSFLHGIDCALLAHLSSARTRSPGCCAPRPPL